MKRPVKVARDAKGNLLASVLKLPAGSSHPYAVRWSSGALHGMPSVEEGEKLIRMGHPECEFSTR